MSMDETELEESLMDCGVAGEHTDAVQVGALNNHMRRAALHHLLPLKREVRKIGNAQRAKSIKDAAWQAKVDAALFDPDEGLINLRKWMTRFAVGLTTVIAAAGGVILWIVTIGRTLHWW